jgi:hypothetical protein
MAALGFDLLGPRGDCASVLADSVQQAVLARYVDGDSHGIN